VAFQFYDRDGNFAGGIVAPPSATASQGLSEAGSSSVSAPYAAWKGLIPEDFRMFLMELMGPFGEHLPHGRWLTCTHDQIIPGNMVAAGNGLLEELRQGCLPPGYYASYRPVLDVLTRVLRASGTEWVLGDTSTAVNSFVTVNLEGQTFLGAVVELCSTSGNYFRHDGRSRVLDILTEPIEDVVATLVCAEGDLEVLPSTYGYAESPQVVINASEVLCGAYPSGGEYVREDSVSEVLYPQGDEILPAGFSFQHYTGGLAIVRNAATEVTAGVALCTGGLLRQAQFDTIAPLSNTEVSANGMLDATTAGGSLTSEVLNRPNDNFWNGGTLEIGGVSYPVQGHIGNTITGGWGAFEARTEFKISKNFPYDAEKVTEARQALVDAVVGKLLANAQAALQVSVTARGLNVVLHPGDAVRLECVGQVEFEDALTMMRQQFTFDTLNRTFIVISVTAEVTATDVIYQLDLTDTMRLLPTEVGIREIHELMKQRNYARKRTFAIVSSEAPSMKYGGMMWVDTSGDDE